MIRAFALGAIFIASSPAARAEGADDQVRIAKPTLAAVGETASRPVITLPDRTLSLAAPETATAGVAFRVRVSITDGVGRPILVPLPRPIFSSALGVEPILGRGVWNAGTTEEEITLDRSGLGRILAVRVEDLAAEVRLDVLPSPRSLETQLAEAEERLAAGDIAGALVTLRHLAERHTASAEVRMRLGDAAIRAGRWDEASAAYREALALTIRKDAPRP